MNMQSLQQLPDYGSRMKTHMARLGSYNQWTYTSSASFPSRLSRAGFFHVGPRDRVKCIECGVQLENWKDGMNINERHRLASESCNFIQRVIQEDYDSGIGSLSSHGSTSSTSSGTSSVENVHGGAAAYSENRMPRISEASNSSKSSGAESVIQVRKQPPNESTRRRKKPPAMFRTLENRVKSYEGIVWPKHLRVQPDNLSNAGFYYVGPDDRVKCGYCGGVLKKWQANDSAIEEHLRHYPECEFVKSVQEKTKVLAQNIRSKKEVKNCISSEVLQKEAAAQRKQKKQNADINTKTLRGLGYSWSLIKRAKAQAIEGQLAINVNTLLPIIQQLERDAFLNGDNGADMDDNESADEDISLNDERKEVHVDSEERFVELQESERHLRKEVEDMKTRMTCKICLTNPIDTLFLTCRHFVTCKDCGDRVRDCPICRQVILGTVDVFIP